VIAVHARLVGLGGGGAVDFINIELPGRLRQEWQAIPIDV